MFLPSNLQHSVELILKDSNIKDIKSSSTRLSETYRKGGSLFNKNDLLTYLTVRLPATYGAILSVLREIPFPVTSLLDLGSGPGTGFFAARELWGALHTTCVEREPAFIELGKRLGCSSYVLGDIEKMASFQPHDLALFGYSFGEFSTYDLRPVWETVRCIAIVEPGTPRGFQNILRARELLIALGGHVLAPCPHSKACPHPTWCHFSVRINRSLLHRHAKKASLPYEDEKYSYVIVTKEPLNREIPRILSHPEKRGGHVRVELCTTEGIVKRTVSKKEKELYKQTRKAQWGDLMVTGFSAGGTQPARTESYTKLYDLLLVYNQVIEKEHYKETPAMYDTIMQAFKQLEESKPSPLPPILNVLHDLNNLIQAAQHLVKTVQQLQHTLMNLNLSSIERSEIENEIHSATTSLQLTTSSMKDIAHLLIS